MKKDKEDLIKYLEKEISNFKSGQMIYDYLTFILKQLNQLDEPETLSIDKEQLIKRIENYIPLHDKTVGDVVDGILEIVKQLPEMEVLSPKWIDDNTQLDMNPTSRVVPAFLLENILVPNQELPVIPKYVAKYLEFAKSDVSLMRVMVVAYSRDELPEWEKEYDWISANDEAFARAWLNGYEVEEQKYYVINNDNGIMLIRMMDGKTITEAMTFFRFEDMSEVEKKSHRLTEQEIKDYDSRYWAFAVAVEELED